MTENSSPPPSAEAAPPPKPAKTARILRYIALLLLLAFALAAGAYAGALWLPTRLVSGADATASMHEKVATLEDTVRTLGARVDSLDTRVDSLASAPPAAAALTEASNAAPIAKTSAADLARVQNDVTALTATVSGLQDEIKRTGAAVAATRDATQATLAESIALIQLRDAAKTGHGFARELAALQTAAGNDAGLGEALGKLAPLAEQGAPTLADLRAELSEQSVGAEQAIAKAEAQNWWERVLAELKGLVTIRPLHGDAATDTTLATMQAALAHDDLAKALEAMNGLPPEAQKTLEIWRAQAEARQTIDDALQAATDHLIAHVNAPSRDTP